MAKWVFDFENDDALNQFDSQYATVLETTSRGVYLEFDVTGERAFAIGGGLRQGDRVLASVQHKASPESRTPFHRASIDSVLDAAA